jgi:hypothetical protein
MDLGDDRGGVADGQPNTLSVCLGIEGDQEHLSIGGTAPVWPKRTWLLYCSHRLRVQACTEAGLERIRRLIREYDERLQSVTPAVGEDVKVTLLAADPRGLVRHGELAGAFDGHNWTEMARCMRCRYTYFFKSAHQEPSLATLRQKPSWPDYERTPGKQSTRIGKCAEVDVDAECEEAVGTETSS